MRSVFVVDDEIPILEWLTMCIKAFDSAVEVTSFCNGEEAWTAVDSLRPELVITDVAMPKMNGLELLEMIKRKGYPTEVIIMSGHQDFEYARNALKFGAVDYILKSEINKENLFALLEKATFRLEQHSPDSDAMQSQALKSAFLKTLLSDEKTACDEAALRENAIRLQNEPFFVAVLPNSEAVLRALDGCAGEKELIQLKNTLVLAANIADGRADAPADFAKRLQDKLGDRVNLGHSVVHADLASFREAVHEAWRARDCRFYQADDSTARIYRTEREHKAIYLRLYELHSDTVNNYHVFGPERMLHSIDETLSFIKSLIYYDADYIKMTICRMLEGLYNNIENIDVRIEEEKERVYAAPDLAGLETVVRGFCTKIPQQRHYSESIEKAVAFLHTHFSQQISLSDVAGHVFLSDEYFSRLFRKEVGETFTDYLTSLRMQEAMKLLKTTSKKIADVCEAVGVPNSKYFALLFKKYYSISPSQVRE